MDVIGSRQYPVDPCSALVCVSELVSMDSIIVRNEQPDQATGRVTQGVSLPQDGIIPRRQREAGRIAATHALESKRGDGRRRSSGGGTARDDQQAKQAEQSTHSAILPDLRRAR
jgi:hypothetical protein